MLGWLAPLLSLAARLVEWLVTKGRRKEPQQEAVDHAHERTKAEADARLAHADRVRRRLLDHWTRRAK